MVKREKKNKWVFTALLVLVFLLGLALIAYPVLSAYINGMSQSRAIVAYEQSLSAMTEEERQELWSRAVAYNQRILSRRNAYAPTAAEQEEYGAMLTLQGDPLIGYVEVPAAEAMLPIYHGTGPSAIQRGAGHLEWTSLPVGGPSTHAVLSSHRGSPSAVLFTHLDRVVEGDLIILHVLNQVLTYQVDQILTVNPLDTKDLLIEEGKDLCTLVTCTPYGVNSHRLLVRGHRVENRADMPQIYLVSEAIRLDEKLVSLFVAVPILLCLLIWSLLHSERKARAVQRRRRLMRMLGPVSGAPAPGGG